MYCKNKYVYEVVSGDAITCFQLFFCAVPDHMFTKITLLLELHDFSSNNEAWIYWL